MLHGSKFFLEIWVSKVASWRAEYGKSKKNCIWPHFDLILAYLVCWGKFRPPPWTKIFEKISIQKFVLRGEGEISPHVINLSKWSEITQNAHVTIILHVLSPSQHFPATLAHFQIFRPSAGPKNRFFEIWRTKIGRFWKNCSLSSWIISLVPKHVTITEKTATGSLRTILWEGGAFRPPPWPLT